MIKCIDYTAIQKPTTTICHTYATNHSFNILKLHHRFLCMKRIFIVVSVLTFSMNRLERRTILEIILPLYYACYSLSISNLAQHQLFQTFSSTRKFLTNKTCLDRKMKSCSRFDSRQKAFNAMKRGAVIHDTEKACFNKKLLYAFLLLVFCCCIVVVFLLMFILIFYTGFEHTRFCKRKDCFSIFLMLDRIFSYGIIDHFLYWSGRKVLPRMRK